MATQLADGVWWLDLGMVNAYLLDGDDVVLVDAGTPGKARAVRDGVRAAGFELDVSEGRTGVRRADAEASCGD